MTMYVVKPITFTPSMLVSTTALEPTPLWVSGTSYAKNAEVTWPNSAGDVRKWISAVNSNTDTPGTSDKWVDNGPCNKCAMFDSKISTQTIAASPLVVEFTTTDIISNLALLNLIGESVKIEMFSGGVKVYEQTANLNESEILDWWDYYFLDDEQITQALFDDLPLFYSPTIKITLTGTGNVAIGHTVFGSRFDLGCLSYGATSGIIDYSKKITDEFGDTEFVKRAFADEFSGQVLVENSQLNGIKRKLRELRATPTLWVGIEDETFRETLVVFGWYRQHRIAINYPAHSLIDLEIEGLT
jgi:hypothetical protein